MSTFRTIGKKRMADKARKFGIGETFGIKACETNFWMIYGIYLIEEVLTWNDTADYLSVAEVKCLEAQMVKNLNC